MVTTIFSIYIVSTTFQPDKKRSYTTSHQTSIKPLFTNSNVSCSTPFAFICPPYRFSQCLYTNQKHFRLKNWTPLLFYAPVLVLVVSVYTKRHRFIAVCWRRFRLTFALNRCTYGAPSEGAPCCPYACDLAGAIGDCRAIDRRKR